MPDFLIVLLHRAPIFRILVGLVIGALLLVAELGRHAAGPAAAKAAWPLPEGKGAATSWVLQGRGSIPMPLETPAAHSSSLLAMPAAYPAVVMAFWFAGTRESAPDVEIAASQFDRSTQQWRPARMVVNRHTLGAQLGFGVRRLGNPVAWLDAQGQVHLFVVATGWGGWAAGRIVHLVQDAAGQDFDQLRFKLVRVLPLSWLWNTSFLVRTAPLLLLDGGMVLPVHFELGLKYPVALRFDAKGGYQGMARISSRPHLLQPTLLMASESNWLALMRDHSPTGKVGIAETRNGGKSWVDLPDLALDNPDSSLAGLSLSPRHMLLVHNSSWHARNRLDLSVSEAAQSWVVGQPLAHGPEGAEYSYPAMTWADGSLWVSYTDHRRSIAWQRFSLAPTTR